MISVIVRARAIEASSVDACVPASSSIARSAAAWWWLWSLTATPRLSGRSAIDRMSAVRDSECTDFPDRSVAPRPP
jgi:hypothetical protein